jgi:hypothetical protein
LIQNKKRELKKELSKLILLILVTTGAEIIEKRNCKKEMRSMAIQSGKEMQLVSDFSIKLRRIVETD